VIGCVAAAILVVAIVGALFFASKDKGLEKV